MQSKKWAELEKSYSEKEKQTNAEKAGSSWASRLHAMHNTPHIYYVVTKVKKKTQTKIARQKQS